MDLEELGCLIKQSVLDELAMRDEKRDEEAAIKASLQDQVKEP
jgi:hypothetical protein